MTGEHFLCALGCAFALGVIASALGVYLVEQSRATREKHDVQRCTQSARDETSAVEGGHLDFY